MFENSFPNAEIKANRLIFEFKENKTYPLKSVYLFAEFLSKYTKIHGNLVRESRIMFYKSNRNTYGRKSVGKDEI